MEIRVIDNDDDRFPDHVLLVGVQDDVEVWRSWAPELVPIEARLNIDHPEAVDHRKGTPRAQKVRWRMPDPEVFAVLDGEDDGAEARRQALKATAAARGLNVKNEVKLRHKVGPGHPSPTT